MTFTSDLHIDEVLLVRETGFEPVELVMGSCYFHTGFQYAGWSQNAELADATRMMTAARRTALTRMLQDAYRLNADGVVGMRLEIHRHGPQAEFTAIGTAVRRRDGNGGPWRAVNGLPFSSTLSGIDFWALVRGGFRPVSMAFGVCVYHVAHQSLGGWLSSISRNCEMTAFTQALYQARELAMGRMQWEAAAAGGNAGVVAVDLREDSHGWDSHVIELTAIGTSVAPIHDPEHEAHEEPLLVLGIQDL